MVSRTSSSRSSTVGVEGIALLVLVLMLEGGGGAHWRPDRLDRNLPMPMPMAMAGNDDDIEEVSKLEQSAVRNELDSWEENSSRLRVLSLGFSGDKMLNSLDSGPGSSKTKDFWSVIRPTASNDSSNVSEGSKACKESLKSDSSGKSPYKACPEINSTLVTKVRPMKKEKRRLMVGRLVGWRRG